MAELVDAADSKSVILLDVGVRVSPRAPHLFIIYIEVYMLRIAFCLFVLLIPFVGFSYHDFCKSTKSKRLHSFGDAINTGNGTIQKISMTKRLSSGKTVFVKSSNAIFKEDLLDSFDTTLTLASLSMKASKVSFDLHTQDCIGQKGVQIQHPCFDVTSDSFQTNFDHQMINLKGHVRFQYHMH